MYKTPPFIALITCNIMEFLPPLVKNISLLGVSNIQMLRK